VLVSALKLLDQVLEPGQLSLRRLSSFLCTWSQSKWWFSFSTHALRLLLYTEDVVPRFLSLALLGLFLTRSGRYYYIMRGAYLVEMSSGGGTRVSCYYILL